MVSLIVQYYTLSKSDFVLSVNFSLFLTIFTKYTHYIGKNKVKSNKPTIHQDRYMEIERENKILLDKMTNIMKRDLTESDKFTK